MSDLQEAFEDTSQIVCDQFAFYSDMISSFLLEQKDKEQAGAFMFLKTII